MGATEDAFKVAEVFAKVWTQRTIPALYALAQGVALKAIQSAQAKAPWTNQTGSARKLLFAEAFKNDEAIGFFISHGVQYGVYLEKANDRKYEILRPTVEAFGDTLLVGVRRIVGD